MKKIILQDPETIEQFISWINNLPKLTPELKAERSKLLMLKMKFQAGLGGNTVVDNKEHFFNKLKLLNAKAKHNIHMVTERACHEY